MFSGQTAVTGRKGPSPRFTKQVLARTSPGSASPVLLRMRPIALWPVTIFNRRLVLASAGHCLVCGYYCVVSCEAGHGRVGTWGQVPGHSRSPERSLPSAGQRRLLWLAASVIQFQCSVLVTMSQRNPGLLPRPPLGARSRNWWILQLFRDQFSYPEKLTESLQDSHSIGYH